MEQGLKAITDFIFLSLPPRRPGLLIIPGTRRPGIIQAALKLYRRRLAKTIITTGGLTDEGLPPEAEYQKQYLIDHGVPAGIIYADTSSANTKENAQNAKKIADKNKLNTSVVILVAKTYHARRLYLTFKKVFNHSRLYLVPALDDRRITAKNWHQSPAKRNKVMEELAKIGEYYLKGDLEL